MQNFNSQNICNNPSIPIAEKMQLGCPGYEKNLQQVRKPRGHRMVIGGGLIPRELPGIDNRVGPIRRRLPGIGDDTRIFPGGKDNTGQIAGGTTIGGAGVLGGGVAMSGFEPIEVVSAETMAGIRQGISSYMSGGGQALTDEGGLELQELGAMDAMNIERGVMPGEGPAPTPYEPLEPLEPIQMPDLPPSIFDAPVEPTPIAPEPAALPEVPESVLSSVKNLLGDQATATMEVPEEGAEASEFTTELGLEEIGDITMDVGAYGAAETTAIGLGAVEGGTEASVAGFAAEAGAEVASEAAIGTAAAIGGEEAGIATGALAGGIALGPETLGLSVVIGGLIAGITAIFANSKEKFNPKHPQAYRIHGGKEGRELAKKFDEHDNTKKYADWIRGPGNVYLVVLGKLGDNGKHIVQVVKQLDSDGLAKAQAVLEKNPDAYKGYDPNVLKALGLNPNLSTQSWNKDPNTIWRDDGINRPTNDEISKATDDINKLDKDLTNQQIFKNNKEALERGDFKGSDKTAMENKLKRFAYDNNIDYLTGKLMTPEQIANKSPIPPIPTVIPKITQKDVLDKMRKKLDGDNSIEFSKGEMDWLKSQGFVEGQSNKGTLDMINQNLIYKSWMDQYNSMADGNDKKYMYQQIQGWLWDHNMNPDGTYMNPDQIKNKPPRPSNVPPDIQKEFDDRKAEYEKNKAAYDQKYQEYQKKLEQYKTVKDLEVERQAVQAELDHKRNRGEDFSDEIDKLKEIGNKMADIHDTNPKPDAPQQPDPTSPALNAAVSPIRRQQAQKAIASGGNA